MLHAIEMISTTVTAAIIVLAMELGRVLLAVAAFLLVAVPLVAFAVGVDAIQHWRTNVERRKRGEPTLPWRWR